MRTSRPKPTAKRPDTDAKIKKNFDMISPKWLFDHFTKLKNRLNIRVIRNVV